MARTRPPRTFLEVCIGRAGDAKGRPGSFRDVPKGARAAMFVVEWAIASMDVGKPLTSGEFAEWWKVSERSVERRRRELRVLFPEHHPQELADLLIAEVDGRRGGVPSPSMVVAL
jgi:hypothetical protein